MRLVDAILLPHNPALACVGAHQRGEARVPPRMREGGQHGHLRDVSEADDRTAESGLAEASASGPLAASARAHARRLPRDFRALLSGLVEANGDGLLPTLHPASRPALERTPLATCIADFTILATDLPYFTIVSSPSPFRFSWSKCANFPRRAPILEHSWLSLCRSIT